MTRKALKLLLLTHAGGSPHHGPNMRWYYLGQALKARGVNVEIISSSYFHKYIAPPKIHTAYETENIDGLTYHWIRTRPYTGRGVWQVLNQFELVTKCWLRADAFAKLKPDFVIASSPHPFVVYPAARIARLAGARLLYEVRDLWPTILLELGSFGRYHPYILLNRAAEAYAIRHAQSVLSVKPGDYDYFAAQYRLPAERFHFLPNGFLPDAHRAAAPQSLLTLRQQYTYLVGYTGAVSRYYSLEDFVDLAAQFRHRPEVGFIVVGGGEQESAIRKRAEQLQLSHFHMTGKIDKAGIPGTLELFDVCYVGLADLDIHKYGISCNKIYEYMHAAKPILGSYVAGHDPVAKSGCGLTRKPGDTAGLALALEKLLADAGLRVDLGQRGKAFFDQTHNFSSVADQLLEHVLVQQ